MWYTLYYYCISTSTSDENRPAILCIYFWVIFTYSTVSPYLLRVEACQRFQRLFCCEDSKWLVGHLISFQLLGYMICFRWFPLCAFEAFISVPSQCHCVAPFLVDNFFFRNYNISLRAGPLDSNLSTHSLHPISSISQPLPFPPWPIFIQQFCTYGCGLR